MKKTLLNMTNLTFRISYPHIIKRYMETSTEEKPSKNKEPEIQHDITAPAYESKKKREIDKDEKGNEEDQLEINKNIDITGENQDWRERIRQKLFSKLPTDVQEKLKEEEKKRHEEWMNSTENNFGSKEPFFVAETVSEEVLLTNVAYKSIVAETNEILQKMGVEVDKSKELAHEWKLHIIELDKYIKSLGKLPWKKIFGYSACILTIAFFIFKMWKLKALPDFLSNLISFVPPIEKAAPPKSTIESIMDMPITPAGIITGVGALTLSFIALRTLKYTLRMLAK